ncbi:GTP-binding protein [Sinorhizobium meliloti]|uniref:GTP-binding protein n=1 Tax=Rhizobium meliloti TaxID=382 RepID=UPI00028618FC|nr:GTP-binding protein [Sinorhizobium meliloti]ASP83060.1 hypothetical protein CDO27_35255 [Sinorhizobium meliloti]MQW20034.1 hypothetical protein [Sinorhizobium meliloti]CCM69577.1 unnamed protein product [Sinorhizobium meliloti Rm41]
MPWALWPCKKLALRSHTQRCNIDLDQVLGRGAFDLDRVLEVEPDFLDEFHEHEHDDHVSSFALVAKEPLDPNKFLPWLGTIIQHLGMDILRMKYEGHHLFQE